MSGPSQSVRRFPGRTGGGYRFNSPQCLLNEELMMNLAINRLHVKKPKKNYESEISWEMI